MKQHCQFIIAFFIFYAGIGSVTAATTETAIQGRLFVVAEQGDDINPGTLHLPWRSLAKAARMVRPGDTVLLRGGLYAAGAVISRSGTKQLPIVFRNFPRERPVIHGHGKSRIGLTLDEVEFVIVRGFEVRGVGEVESLWDYRILWGGVLLKDARDCVVEANVLVTGDADGTAEQWIGAPGIRLWSSDPAKGSLRNLIRGNDASHGWSGAHTIGPARGNVFEGNHFHHNRETQENSDGAGQDNAARKLQSVRDKTPFNPKDNIYRYNIFSDNADDGLDMWVSTGNLVEYNLAHGNGEGSTGDGIGFKMGPGGYNTIRFCLASMNRRMGFSDNRGQHNIWENNFAIGNGRSPEAGPGWSQAGTEEAWRRNKQRLDIHSRIQEYRSALTEDLPPNPPRHVRRQGDSISWGPPTPARDGDTAEFYLLYLDADLIDITAALSLELPPDTKGKLCLRAVDDSYLDNQSKCIQAVE